MKPNHDFLSSNNSDYAGKFGEEADTINQIETTQKSAAHSLQILNEYKNGKLVIKKIALLRGEKFASLLMQLKAQKALSIACNIYFVNAKNNVV